MEPEERREAARRAFECDLPGTPQEFAALVAEGERCHWPEVVRAGMYGLLRHAAEPAGADPSAEVERLIARAEMDEDLDTLALALAWRGFLGATRLRGTTSVVDEDLARSAVMLGSSEGNPVVKATAHFRLAFSYMHRNLWELADEQFASAEVMVDAVDPLAKDPLLHRAALAYDRVMVQLDWGCALRSVGGPDAARTRREVQEALVAAADCVDMPPAWREDVRIARLLLDIVAGARRSEEVQDQLAYIARTGDMQMWEGHLHLALALSPDELGLTAAEREAGLAIEMIDAEESRAVYDLALHQATVLEAAVTGGRTAGLRSAEELAAQREVSRQRSVAAMRAAIAAVRLRNERDLLARHAYVDPLTGLENRRGFDRHVAGLQECGVEQVAMLVFDVDHFKRVNDTLGHAAGDTVLRRVADVLTANVRSGDFAARFGGDEFVLVLSHSTHQAAVRRSEAIAAEIADQTWRDIGPQLSVSVSAGVATGHPGSINLLGHQADMALYQAKSQRADLATPA
jgi:diguanylate cyclase (GGDEF)-like protein